MSNKLKTIYGKPLTKAAPLDLNQNKGQVLEKAGEEAIKAIQKEIMRFTFKSKPDDLLKSFSYKVGSSSVSIESTHPAAKYLDKGVRPYQMKHLVKATRPIPIIKDNGELIFRNATQSGMNRGKWKHPGIKARNFMDRGVEAAKKTIKEQIQEDIKNKVKSRFRGK